MALVSYLLVSFLLSISASVVWFASTASGLYTESGWQPAIATWYGSPDGAGTDGGACGYGSLPNTPYGSNVAAGSPILFQNGLGCGQCYKVKCLNADLCSATPVTVVITDNCPGCSGSAHFDLSGSAFGQMASSAALRQSLLNAGLVQTLYMRVPCSYPSTPIQFQVNQGATNYWFSVLIKYEAGEGDLLEVALMQANSGEWEQMDRLWGAYWCMNAGPLSGPFSIRLTSSSGSTITAYNVIPGNWSAGSTYDSDVNFSFLP